jgi:hypothetical protein
MNSDIGVFDSNLLTRWNFYLKSKNNNGHFARRLVRFSVRTSRLTRMYSTVLIIYQNTEYFINKLWIEIKHILRQRGSVIFAVLETFEQNWENKPQLLIYAYVS